MEKRWSLYRHTSPSGKVYIGITTQKPSVRWEYGNGYKGSHIFYRAIKKYGWNNIKHEVLFTNLEESRAKTLEINLIRHYRNLGLVYNILDGGGGTTGRIISEETRKKMRDAKLGKKLSIETRNKMSELRKGGPGTMLGKKHSEETKKKMSASRKGKKINRSKSKEMIDIYRKAQKTCKKVARVNPDSNIIEETYDSIKLASKMNNCARSHIADCCYGKIKLFKGYKWIFING